MNSLIIRQDSSLSATLAPECAALKVDALTAGALIGRVSNAAEQTEAVLAQSKLQELLSRVENDRKEIKAPVIELGRKIDECAKQFRKELEDEIQRISTLIADFQTLELQKQRAAQAAQDQEASRLEKERMEALSKVKSHDEADAVQEHFNQKAAMMPVTPIPSRVAGQRIVEDWEITVTNPYDLARFHPNCVNISPRLSEIKMLLNNGMQVKGVTAKKIVKAGIRPQQPRTIEV